MEEKDTLVCAGIDPTVERFPAEIRDLTMSDTQKTARFLETYVDTVAPHVCVFKAQKAYFDLLSGGQSLLRDIIAHAHERHGIPVIIDAKVGDIDETMRAYRKNLFDVLGADGIVVNPYMGDDVMLPLADYPDKLIVPLVKTSNPGGAIVQDMKLEDGRFLWQRMLELVAQRWNDGRNMAPVIASTQEIDAAMVRKAIPDAMPVFYAGMGAQGGSADALRGLLDSQGRGVLVNSSRGLMYPRADVGQSWQQAIGESVIAFKALLNRQRR